MLVVVPMGFSAIIEELELVVDDEDGEGASIRKAAMKPVLGTRLPPAGL